MNASSLADFDLHVHHGPGGYGRALIETRYRRHVIGGLLIAALVAATVGGLSRAALSAAPDEEVGDDICEIFNVTTPPPVVTPPPIVTPPPPANLASAHPAGPPPNTTNQIIAVPDNLADMTQTLASQIDLSHAQTLIGQGDSLWAEGGSPSGQPGGTGPIFTETPPEPEIFTVVEAMPEVVHRVAPTYPALAKQAGIQGNVFVQAIVDESGRVISAELVRDIGGGCGTAALDAVKQWTFTPGRQRGRAVKVRIVVPVSFKLR